MSGRSGETLGLWIMGLVGQRFLRGEPPVTRDQLHRDLPAVPEHVDRVVEILLHHGLLAESGADGAQLLPRRDPDSVTVAQLWQLLREGFDGRPRLREGLAHEVQELLEKAESGFAESAGRQTLREWLGGARPPPAG